MFRWTAAAIILGLALVFSAQYDRAEAAGPTPSEVRDTQRLLSDLGYAPGPADGVMGQRTRTAIKSFQRDRGMTPDGAVDNALLTALRRASDDKPFKDFMGKVADDLDKTLMRLENLAKESNAPD